MGVKNVSATMEATVGWLQLLCSRAKTDMQRQRRNWELQERDAIGK